MSPLNPMKPQQPGKGLTEDGEQSGPVVMDECRITRERLTPFVDQALPPSEHQEVERHLTSCPPCRDAAAAEGGGRLLLHQCRATLRSEALPPGLRSRCEAMARSGARAPFWRATLLPGMAVAAVVLVVAAAAFAVATRRSATLLAAQLTADHVKCFRIPDPSGATGVDARAVEDALARRFGRAMHVPPSSRREGVELLGARRCLYAEGSVPHVLYRVNGQSLSLFVFDGQTRAPADVVTFGHRARMWSRGSNTYVLVSPASAGDLGPAVQYVRQQVD